MTGLQSFRSYLVPPVLLPVAFFVFLLVWVLVHGPAA
jgi:hypothetical protein